MNAPHKYFTPLLFACAIIFSSLITKAQQYDVCVYGGTSAGVIAAYSTAKMGKSVLLISTGKHLGGLTSGGLGYTDIGNKYAITGLARDFYRRLGKHYGKFEQWVFEPHVAENLFKEYINLARIKVIYDYRIINAEKINGFIKKIIIENSSSPSTQTNKTIAAKMFIDCSYEGDLMAKAGVSYTTGRESNNIYNEKYNGVELRDKHQFPDGVDPYKIPSDSTSGLLWGISNNKLEENGTGDKKIQTYNYRICLTDDSKNFLPINCPENYDSSKYELLLRLMKAQPEKKSLHNYFSWDLMPNHKTDINNNGAFSTDMIGMNYDYPEADYNRRAAIIKQHEDYTKGLLYFIGHDERVPEEIKNEISKWGYPKDEYADNNNWSPQLYIRECRRMVGEYIMTQANCEGHETVNDGVGLAAYTMDSHNCERMVINRMVKNEGDVQVGGFGPYPVSYRSLIPKKSECKNLFVPVCLSASHIAYGSIRMEPVFMVLAQSTAVAACMAIDAKQTVQEINIEKLQNFLHKNPLLNGTVSEILIDNGDSANIKVTGNWKKENSGGYIKSFLVAEPSKENKVIFTTAISKTGKYSIYAYLPKIDNPSSQINFEIFDGFNTKKIIVRIKDIKAEGQTSGEWVKLGGWILQKGNKSSITITGENADGNIVADALLFVPVK